MVSPSTIYHSTSSSLLSPSTRGSKLAQILEERNNKERATSICTARRIAIGNNKEHAAAICTSRSRVSASSHGSSATISTASSSSISTNSSDSLPRAREKSMERKVNKNTSVSSSSAFSFDEDLSSKEMGSSPPISPPSDSEKAMEKLNISGDQRRAYLRELRMRIFKEKGNVGAKLRIASPKRSHISNLMSTIEDVDDLSRDEKDSLLCMSDDVFSDTSHCLSHDTEKNFGYQGILKSPPKLSEAVETASESSSGSEGYMYDHKNMYQQGMRGPGDRKGSNGHGHGYILSILKKSTNIPRKKIEDMPKSGLGLPQNRNDIEMNCFSGSKRDVRPNSKPKAPYQTQENGRKSVRFSTEGTGTHYQPMTVHNAKYSIVDSPKSATLRRNQDGSMQYTSDRMERARNIIKLRKLSPRMKICSPKKTHLMGGTHSSQGGVDGKYPTFIQQQRQEQHQLSSPGHEHSAKVPSVGNNVLLSSNGGTNPCVQQEARRRIHLQQQTQRQFLSSTQLSASVPAVKNDSPDSSPHPPPGTTPAGQGKKRKIQKSLSSMYPPFRPLEQINAGGHNNTEQQHGACRNPSGPVAIKSPNTKRSVQLPTETIPEQKQGSPSDAHRSSPILYLSELKLPIDGDQEELVQFNKIIHPPGNSIDSSDTSISHLTSFYNNDRESISERMRRAKKWGKKKGRNPRQTSFDLGHSGSSQSTECLTLESVFRAEPDVEVEKYPPKNEVVGPTRCKHHKDLPQGSKAYRGGISGIDDKNGAEMSPMLENSNDTPVGKATVVDTGNGIEVGYNTSEKSKGQHSDLSSSSSISICYKTQNESASSDVFDSIEDGDLRETFTSIDSGDSSCGESTGTDLAQKFLSLFL